jgi:endonuclease/exonuclease/phosphatase family metal-dependent hydrolase
MDVSGIPSAALVRWRLPLAPGERRELESWCATVGPAVFEASPADTGAAVDRLFVVSWNTHVGGGDLLSLVEDLRQGRLTEGLPVRHFVLLLQEAHRAGASVPQALELARGVPGSIRPRRGAAPRLDVMAWARRTGLAVYYAPSMRNGRSVTGEPDEDRGNAILSTLPLADPEVIELPFERQRRAAVTAIVAGRSPLGTPWRLRVGSAHLDNLAGLQRLWVFAEGARARQARALAEAVGADAPAIVGGDFNTWLGAGERALETMASAFPQTPPGDGKPTFSHRLRLDHLFFRVPSDWTVTYRRIDDRYGSDHYPLLGSVAIRM